MLCPSGGGIQENLADLIHFVEDKANLVNDPLFSKEALSGYVDKRDVPVKRLSNLRHMP